MVSKPPNVILIMADQLRADALGCAGNPIVKTPHIDKLAAEGVMFNNAFTNCPVCMASRGAILTGRYPRTIRQKSMDVLSPNEITMAETFKRNGYRTGMFGKLHLTPQGYTRKELHSDHAIDDAGPFIEATKLDTYVADETLNDPCKKNYGFDESSPLEDSVWGDYTDWLKEQGRPDLVPVHLSENWNTGRQGQSFGQEPAKCKYADSFDSNMEREFHPSKFIVDKTIEFSKSSNGKPFFAVCSFVDPHHPFNAPKPYLDMYPPDQMEAPRAFDSAKCFPENLPQGVREQIERRQKEPDDAFRWALANYYGMISNIDWNIGRLVDALREQGVLDDTIILFTADHGEHVGDHRLLLKGSLLFDGLMRIPLIARFGKNTKQGHCVDRLVQEIDFYPTIMSLAGMPIHAGVQGKDLSPMLRGEGGDVHEYVTCELDELVDKAYMPTVAVRTRDWKLIYYPGAHTGMMFNLVEDPGEYNNLYFDEAHREKRHELMGLLIDDYCLNKDPLPVRLSQA